MNMRRVKPWLSATKESKESMSASESYRGASFCGICGRGRLSGEPTWPDCMHMDFVVCFNYETSEFLSEYSQLNSARATGRHARQGGDQHGYQSSGLPLRETRI